MQSYDWIPSSSLVDLHPDPTKRNKAVARRNIPVGSTVLSTPAFATALLDSEKGHRCDHCLREQTSLKKCSGCGSYWYCDAKCQNLHWQTNHKRLCKRIGQFENSVTFQQLEKHERMDSLLLSHLLAQLSTLNEPYSPRESRELEVALELLPGPASNVAAPPVCPIKPAPPSQRLVEDLFARFGNNNFTIHSHLNSIAHGVFPVASRLFNHSCVPNAVAKYVFSAGNTVTMEVVSLRDIAVGEEICIPYIDPALMQTRHQVFQITYGFVCDCPACAFLRKIGTSVPEPPEDATELAHLGAKLRDFVGVDEYLKGAPVVAADSQPRSLDDLPPALYCVLHESYMSTLSEAFSRASHEGDYVQAAESGVTLLALYLLVYPKNYPQIGMHLLEMAKTQWNHSFVALNPAGEDKEVAKNIVFQLLDLARSVLRVLGMEGDSETGPFREIEVLEDIARNA
ncbi:hypothetical protein DFP72DRAFT_964622 [Ephemerocybe angulata]|uniref:SET domain-containing protein n=1 Tax=Ephemerocybe angulata TaxID=980116 RepID=A0A8H6I1Z9_9AGAR|nr:hypothetical protein DFP72DRAFT_964622 [Tulosesus angulatus]